MVSIIVNSILLVVVGLDHLATLPYPLVLAQDAARDVAHEVEVERVGLPPDGRQRPRHAPPHEGTRAQHPQCLKLKEVSAIGWQREKKQCLPITRADWQVI